MHHCVLNSIATNVPLEPGRFKEAVNIAFRQHYWLRTSLESAGLERPVQAVRADWPGALIEEVDLRALTPEEQSVAVMRYAELDRATPFPLHEPHAYRYKILRVSEQKYTLLDSMHYVRADGWSNEFVGESVTYAYRGMRAPQAHRPPYDLYAEWLRRQDVAALKERWLAKLKAYRPRAVFRDREPTGENLGVERHWTRLSRDLLVRLIGSARNLGVTPSTVFASAWALICEAWGGEDVCFGMSLAGRPAEIPDVDHISGPQLTILPMRIPVARNLEFGRLAQSIHREVGDLVASAHTPQTELHEWCDIPLTTSLFESYIYLRNYPQAGKTGFESTAQRTIPDPPYTATGFPLRVEVGRLFSEDYICLYYYKRFFSAQRIALLLQQFVQVLEQVSLRPHGLCSDLNSSVDAVKS
jgi:hypothetical protein